MLGIGMLATGCVAGILAGLFGIGGGIIIVPVLELALTIVGVDAAIRMHVAVATSLATIVPTSLSSARAHHRKQAVDLVIFQRWAIYVFVGALCGVWIASQLHSRVLALVFAVFAMVVAVKMMLWPASRQLTDGIPDNVWVKAIPTAIGTTSSMMGIGGGTFSVLVLTLFNQPIHRAIGTASLLGLVISLPGTAAFVFSGWGDPRLPAGSLGYVSLVGFALIAPTTVLAAPIGAKIAHAFPARTLSIVFGIFLLIASLRFFFTVLA